MFRGAPAPILPAAAPDGPGWVYAVIARRTYRHRLGFAEQDLALQPEGGVLVLHSGWRFIEWRPRPLVEILADGWIPRPAALDSEPDNPKPAREAV